MAADIAIQRAVPASPADSDLRAWAQGALPQDYPACELCIRIVAADESAQLNQQYRNKRGATNVLSFPCDAEIEQLNLLGDLVICASIVEQQALEQRKPPAAHWAHMVVHGVLHLLGYDHIGDHEAIIMEAEERAILARLGFSDPYIHEQHTEGA